MNLTETEVAIVGAGLSGLAAARGFQEAGVAPLVLEASDRIGGRVETVERNGFRLDRGFQVLLKAYPAAQALLDYERLDLRDYWPGADVWRDGRCHRLGDPLRRPADLLKTIAAPIGTWRDKLLILKLRRVANRGTLTELFARRERQAREYLETFGFSPRMIESFFTPFYRGVFLDPQLETSSRMLEFTFRMFSQGAASIPARGIGEIPLELARPLEADLVRLNCRVESIEPQKSHIRLETTHGAVQAKQVVVATQASATEHLLGLPTRPWQSVRTLYYAADEPPFESQILVLNGSGSGVVNNLTVPTLLSDKLAPAGQHLISVTVVEGGEISELESQVRAELKTWYGKVVDDWMLIESFDIAEALPKLSVGNQSLQAHNPHAPGVWIWSDTANPSIQGALEATRLAEEMLGSATGSASGQR